MKIYKDPGQKRWEAICRRPGISREELFPRVREIMGRVKKEGDAALISYAKRFDGADIAELRCTPAEMRVAEKRVPESLKADIRLAIKNVRRFHAAQKREREDIETAPGVTCWREARPIERVGLYIPGGTAPLFSSVIMLGVPAVLAGCREIVLCTPPRKDGSIHPAILWTAMETGIGRICKAGGAQAVAAMAYGTASVPKTDKILGPGNQYVTAAKLLASTDGVAIDMPAGPSEVLVIADSTADPAFVAADLLSQAEHGVDSQVLLVTTDAELPGKVEKEIAEQLRDLPRREIAEASLEYAAALVFGDLETCMDFSNRYAPEHLILQTAGADALTAAVVNAGSVFVGALTPESAGDYGSGTNHTLPTNGYAVNYSGVSLDSYVKILTFQKISARGLRTIGPSLARMAAAEELDAHRLAVTRRLKRMEREGDSGDEV